MLTKELKEICILGQGGFGETSLVERDGSRYVLKCLKKSAISAYGDTAINLFMQESEYLRKLGDHPQIPALIESGMDADDPWILQEYIPGENLEQVLAKQGTFTEAEIVNLLKSLLPVVGFIHAQHAIHRDIKPANIIWSDNQYFLVDFGASKRVSETVLRKTGTTIGSAGYAAPEQTLGKAIFASDLYSLGVTCAHLLTGIAPFDLIDVGTGQWCWHDYMQTPVSEGFGLILDKMLEQGTHRRYSSSAEVLDALEQIDRRAIARLQDAQLDKTREEREKEEGELGDSTITATMNHFDFETATIAKENRLLGLRREWVIRRLPAIAWGYTEPLSSSIGLDMIAIPGGSFMMGAPETEPRYEVNERPQHEVTLQPFYLSRYAVTQAQWREVAGYDPIEKELDPDPSSFKGDQRPVETVSWEDAQEFCQRLSQKTGQDYRLPSESQWEYACRAGTTTPFHFGETVTTELANYGWAYNFNDWPKGEYRDETMDVGRFPGNDWGLHDMHGNVWEWCEDDWHSDYKGALSDERSWVASDRTGIKRVVRGGSWYYDLWHCRSAYRDYATRADRYNGIGFRVCCVPPSPLLSP
ncbi:MAG: bifunctional serine/threonine-protein kinase/formylglycine-generating enzyme family protein [Thermosynechococcaceae cyanobacterium]